MVDKRLNCTYCEQPVYVILPVHQLDMQGIEVQVFYELCQKHFKEIEDSQLDKDARLVLNLISTLENDNLDPVPYSAILAVSEVLYNLTKEDLEIKLRNLLREALIFESEPNHYNLVNYTQK